MKKRLIPKQIQITPEVAYRVKWRRNLLDEGYCGLTFFHDKEIHLAEKMGTTETLETFFHEILHGIAHEYNFDLPHKLIYQLEKGLAYVFAKNFIQDRIVDVAISPCERSGHG